MPNNITGASTMLLLNEGVRGSNSSMLFVISDNEYGPTYITRVGSTYLNLYISQQKLSSLSRRFHDSINRVAHNAINIP